jgi:hypothetical protein
MQNIERLTIVDAIFNLLTWAALLVIFMIIYFLGMFAISVTLDPQSFASSMFFSSLVFTIAYILTGIIMYRSGYRKSNPVDAKRQSKYWILLGFTPFFNVSSLQVSSPRPVQAVYIFMNSLRIS